MERVSPSSDESSTEALASTSADASILTQADIGVAQLTSTGEIAAANDAFVNITSYPRKKLIGEAFTHVLTTFPPSLEAILKGNSESITLTLPVATGEGRVIACESLLKTITDEESNHDIVAILYRGSEQTPDSTQELKPDQDSKIAPAKAFVALADALSEGIIVLDTESQIQYANSAVEQILGYTPDELVGGSKLSIIPEHLREAHLNALNRYLETGTKNIDWEYVELPGQHKDGHEVPLGISLNDFFFDNDRYFVGLFRDITPRKEAEQALRDREQQLDQYKEYTSDILDAIDDMFYVLDEEGHLQRWNQTLCDVTGYTDEEVTSMHALDLFDDDQSSIEDSINGAFEIGQTRLEADLITKHGKTIPYEFIASKLEDPDGNPVLAGIGRDITKRKEQRRKLEESNERLEQFAYAASHDLQEPLRMITSYLQLIESRYKEDLDQDGEEFLEFAIDGAERMKTMIEGLLEYSRVDTQGDPMEQVNLNTVVDDVTDDLQLKIDETDATIRSDDLPTVMGDDGQLRQVFQNLLNNAIEYNEEGSPEVDISVEQREKKWKISVQDNGIGIDPSETDRIFEVFQRLHPQDAYSGTGLGLALSRRIIERHGGNIWVDSEPEEGSTFFITLPKSN